MPDLNLMDEEGTEGTASSASSRPGGGGGMGKILIVVVVLVVLGGGVFLLNKFGIIKLWGKKTPPPVVQVEENQFPTEQFPTDEQLKAAMQDTSMAELLETPPVEEGKKAPEPAGAMMPAAPGHSKLAEMSGDYTIQVSAWRDQATAEMMVKRLVEAGYPAFVEKRTYKDGTWYTVRIGRYPSIKDARKAVESFALELRSNYWIDKVRSK